MGSLIAQIDHYSIGDYIISLLTHDTYHDCETMKMLCKRGFVHHLFEGFLKNNPCEVTRIIREIVLWKHSYNVGIAGEAFVDYCNTEALLHDVYQSIFSNKDADGIEMIGNLLTLSSSNEECCMIPRDGLPSIYRFLFEGGLVDEMTPIQQIAKWLKLKEDGEDEGCVCVGKLRVQLVYLVLSLVVSNYNVIFCEMASNRIIESVLVCI